MSQRTKLIPKSANKLQLTYRRLDSLQPHPKNPRQHSKTQVKKVSRSIEAFGNIVPILVDRDLTILAGHARALASELLGWDEVPTISVEHLTPTQAQAFMLADNKIGDLSSFDDKLLKQNLKELSDLALDFDIEAIGFETAELDLHIQDLSGSNEPPEDLDRLFDKSKPAVCQRGDLFQLGPHRLLCDDALESSSYQRLLGEERAEIGFADPPFNVRIKGNASGNGRVKHDDFVMAAGELSKPVFEDFLTTAFRHMAAHSCAGSIHFVCMDWRHLGEILKAGTSIYGELKNLIVWVKNNAGMGSLYRSQHELIFVFKTAGAPHRNNVCLGKYGRNRTNVWNYAGATSPAQGDDERCLLHLHPTVKPVTMVADALMDCSGRNALVLDPFAGSGTTIIAAQRTGRRARAIELDPKYVDAAIRRWQDFTRQDAIHVGTGRAFSAMEPRS